MPALELPHDVPSVEPDIVFALTGARRAMLCSTTSERDASYARDDVRS